MKYFYPFNQIPNFFIWWYAVKGREIFLYGARFMLKMIGYLNLFPMILNLHRPYFADSSFSGYFYSLVLRLIWISTGFLVLIPVFVLTILVVMSWFLFPIYMILSIIDPSIAI